eukprot:TRINITY_DN3203_c0_g1_i3.p1 TRINITY_DN3203_c0_g1~~TRINITY_DN3203_c0_g1_i3.p1  ORF type:complete len:749 (-),score=244.39 TRINITY_DN3203_c0_g1_i3:50-2296(-)
MEGLEEHDGAMEDGTFLEEDNDSSDEWDDEAFSKNQEMDQLMNKAPENIVLKAQDQARAEVKATMNSAESLKDIALLIRGREAELAAKVKERSQVLKSQVSSARNAIALLDASKTTIHEIGHKFVDVKEHSDKKKITHKADILELSFKHEMIDRIVNSVDLIKSVQRSDGILKDLRHKIQNASDFERDIASIHAKIEQMERLRDSLGKMALDTNEHFEPSDMAESFAQRVIGTPLSTIVSSFEETMWFYMEDCLTQAMEKPWILVKINNIIEFEEERDLDRAEQGAPFMQKRWRDVCDQKINDFIEKRFEFFRETDPKERESREYKMFKENEPDKKSSGEMKIIAAHLAGSGVTIEELHRRIDDLGNIKEYMIPCFPSNNQTGESRAEEVYMSILAQFHTRIFKFLHYLCEQKEMLLMAPRAVVAYIDFIENYYWRIEDQLFLDPECKQLSPHLRAEISVHLRDFYLDSMRSKFKEFAEQIIDTNYDEAGKAVDAPPEDGILKSAAIQDVFNMLYQNIDIIEQMNDPIFLCQGFKRLGDCLFDYTSQVKRKLAFMENALIKGDHFLWACTVINDTADFVKQSDIFVAKALASTSEYSELLVDADSADSSSAEASKFEEITASLMGVQSEAFDALANTLLAHSVKRHISHLFVRGKWYDTRQFGKKSASAKLPVIIQITDELHEHFRKIAPCLAAWEMLQLVTLVLRKLVAHYVNQIFLTDAISLEEQTPDGLWKYTCLLYTSPSPRDS